MPEISISAEPRTAFGKGDARRTRRAGKVPGVVYGHGQDPVHITLPGHDLMLALKQSNVLLRLDLDGTRQLVLPKQVQRDPIKGFLQHIDLVLVRRGEKVTVDVPLAFVGEAALDTLVSHEQMTLSVEAEATTIPNHIQVDITGRGVGDHITAGDVILPAGATLAADPEQVVVSMLASPTAAQVEADLTGAEAGAGIEREPGVEAAEAAAES